MHTLSGISQGTEGEGNMLGCHIACHLCVSWTIHFNTNTEVNSFLGRILENIGPAQLTQHMLHNDQAMQSDIQVTSTTLLLFCNIIK